MIGYSILSYKIVKKTSPGLQKTGLGWSGLVFLPFMVIVDQSLSRDTQSWPPTLSTLHCTYLHTVTHLWQRPVDSPLLWFSDFPKLQNSRTPKPCYASTSLHCYTVNQVSSSGSPVLQNSGTLLWQCYNFKQLRQSSTVVGSKVQGQMSLEECKS